VRRTSVRVERHAAGTPDGSFEVLCSPAQIKRRIAIAGRKEELRIIGKLRSAGRWRDVCARLSDMSWRKFPTGGLGAPYARWHAREHGIDRSADWYVSVRKTSISRFAEQYFLASQY